MWGRCGDGTGAASAEDLVPGLRATGYVGLEGPAFQWARIDDVPALLAEHGVRWIPLVFADGADAAECADSLERQLPALASCSPPVVNVHGGADRFPLEESARFFRLAAQAAQREGVRLVHETHRSRPLHSPWTTLDLVRRVPELRLNADLSHWVNVMERFFDDSELAAVIDRVDHIHARVGHEQGPQVADPSTAHWHVHTERHLHWWDLIWSEWSGRGLPSGTMTPEFGPPPYQPVGPDGEQVGDFIASNDWMADRLRSRFT